MELHSRLQLSLYVKGYQRPQAADIDRAFKDREVKVRIATRANIPGIRRVRHIYAKKE